MIACNKNKNHKIVITCGISIVLPISSILSKLAVFLALGYLLCLQYLSGIVCVLNADRVFPGPATAGVAQQACQVTDDLFTGRCRWIMSTLTVPTAP